MLSFGITADYESDARLGYAYVMIKTDFYLLDDPREKTLRDAIYASIAALERHSVQPSDSTVLAPQWR